MSSFVLKGSKFFVDVHTAKYSPWVIQAIERDFYRCVKCGEPNVEKLIVHHIDESRKLGIDKMNNNLDNLMTLCKPCHARIHKQTVDVIRPNFEKIKEMFQQGSSYSEIGKEIGISRQRVHQILKASKML